MYKSNGLRNKRETLEAEQEKDERGHNDRSGLHENSTANF